jgi:hypothetical protein
MLSILVYTVIMTSIGWRSFEQSFAQREDIDDHDDAHNSNNNVIGQDGDGDKASQSDSISQETNQNILYVSVDHKINR